MCDRGSLATERDSGGVQNRDARTIERDSRAEGDSASDVKGDHAVERDPEPRRSRASMRLLRG